MQAPLQVIPLDDDRTGNLAVASALELRPNVHQPRTLLRGIVGRAGRQPGEPAPSGCEKPVQRVPGAHRQGAME
jgi:hypothetical protein